MEKDYYKILEVHPQASPEIIRKAYQVLALRYHPDRHIPAKKNWAEEKFKELSEAYQILSNSVKRKDYDRNGYSEQLVQESEIINARSDEEAYFYYRMGLQHYKKAQKKTGWRILLGAVDSDLRKAQDDFITVLNEYAESKYTEDAHFYYICTLMESYEYSQDFLKETEEEFTEFLDEFPRSQWIQEIKIRFAKFYLFKKRDYSKADELLADIRHFHCNANLALEEEILSEYIHELHKNT